MINGVNAGIMLNSLKSATVIVLPPAIVEYSKNAIQLNTPPFNMVVFISGYCCSLLREAES